MSNTKSVYFIMQFIANKMIGDFFNELISRS